MFANNDDVKLSKEITAKNPRDILVGQIKQVIKLSS